MMRLTPAYEESTTETAAAAVVKSRKLARLTGGRVPQGPWQDAAHVRPSIKLPVPQSEIWPAEVDMILSAMQAGGGGAWLDQRRAHRVPYRMRAELSLFSEGRGGRSQMLYCRDIDVNGMGFITTEPLPLGYGGTVTIFTPSGQTQHVACTLTRCREAVSGWYEGALRFHARQAVFAEQL